MDKDGYHGYDACKHDWHFIMSTNRLHCQRCHQETGGIDWSALTIPTEKLQGYKLHDSRPTNTIQFYGGPEPRTEVLRISREGIWANPDIPTDEAAKKVLEAIDGYVKTMIEQVREDDTGVSWGIDWGKAGNKSCATIIKRLPGGKIEVVAVEYEP